MDKTPLERPTVRISKSGVSSVSAYDVLRSKVGQAELRKTVRSSIYTNRSTTRSLEKGESKKQP